MPIVASAAAIDCSSTSWVSATAASNQGALVCLRPAIARPGQRERTLERRSRRDQLRAGARRRRAGALCRAGAAPRPGRAGSRPSPRTDAAPRRRSAQGLTRLRTGGEPPCVVELERRRARAGRCPGGSRARRRRRAWERREGRPRRPRAASTRRSSASRRGGVQPLRVVCDDQQRPRVRGAREDVESRGADREPVERRPSRPRPSALCRASRLARWELRQVAEERPQQLQQPRVLQLGLGLDAEGPDDRQAGSARSTAYSSSEVLPIPASPRISSAPLRPPRPAASSSSRRAQSGSRPMSRTPSDARPPALGTATAISRDHHRHEGWCRPPAWAVAAFPLRPGAMRPPDRARCDLPRKTRFAAPVFP